MAGVEIRYLGSGRLLDAAQRARVRAELADAMPRHDVFGYLDAKPRILIESDHIAVAESVARCVGLMAASEFVADTLPFTYIETLLVGERHHGAGVAAGLISVLFADVVRELGDFPDIVAMKTYTPKAYVLMRRFALGGDIAFSPDISRRPDGAESVQRATRLARFLSPECEFHPGTSVVRGGGGPITGRFWRYEPLCCDPAVNSFFRREVGDRDRVLCIVHAPTPEAKERLITALRIGPPITKTVRSHG